MVDDHHRGNAVYWMNQGRVMREAIRPLIGKSQTDRMKAFYALPSHLKSVDALVRATQEERERWRESRELAVYYMNHPDEGKKITKMRLEEETTTVPVAATSPKKENQKSANEAPAKTPAKTPAKKTPAKKTPAKKTPAKKSTSATVKKSASKPKSTSSSKAGVVKKKKEITRTPATQEETMNPTHPLAAILERGIEELKRLHR
jgi:hypothetical protein